jgi:hypothetical protein
MHKGKVLLLLSAAALLLAGCASRLGYPSRAVGIPTPVTLFSKIAPKASLNNTMLFGARDLWNLLYQKKFEEVLSQLAVDRLNRQLNVSFSNDAGKAHDLFTPSSSEVLDIGVDYAKSKADPPAYSGFDFSAVKDTIPTQYILALTIDEWGLLAAQNDKDNGPYIAMTIQLIDKDTNMSAWKYHYQFLSQVDKAANEITKPQMFTHILEKLIEQSVDQYFMWLGW